MRTPFVTLNANLNYREPRRGPRLKRVIFRNGLSKKEALKLCTSTEGYVDLVTELTPNDARQVESSQYARLVTSDGNEVVTGVFNRFQSEVDFDSYDLRASLNMAIQREEIVQNVYKGMATLTPALTPPWAYDFPEGLEPIKYDFTKSRELFLRSNYPKDRPLKIAAFKKHESLLHVVAAQIQKTLSTQVTTIVVPQDQEVKWKRVVAEKKLNPGWDILLASTTTQFYEGTPAFFHREMFGSDGALRTGPELPGFDQIYKKMANQVQREELLAAAKEVDRYVFEKALSLFLCVPQKIYAVNKHVDFKPYRTTLELAETEVGEMHWSRKVR
ncbi:ABC transporter substrate-binding protein [Halobacillus amylolyticus]|uniref:ABC transporter substrate-binding protein n=1 Tax=Halobacillus amylolyticus TaxID=2932259 RepID=A0ABY4HCV5_9BACI|nr:ABC transporter substrate-binding protein [Halobacillus amylolyticus]UOR12554.1 ABC transporter substrate-binding protein [Halobacillus amylolyticus]